MDKKRVLTEFILIFILILYCSLLIRGDSSSNTNEQNTATCKYALVMLQEEQAFFITDTVITAGMLKNEIILYYKPFSHTYFYVYVVQPGRTFAQIRPVAFTDLDKLDYNYKSELIFFSEEKELQPGGGCREIHLLISTKRLPEIEKLIGQLNKTGKEADSKERLTELGNRLNREIQNLKVKKILGNKSPQLPLPVNSSFRSKDVIGEWLDKNKKIATSSIKEIHEIVYQCECEAE